MLHSHDRNASWVNGPGMSFTQTDVHRFLRAGNGSESLSQNVFGEGASAISSAVEKYHIRTGHPSPKITHNSERWRSGGQRRLDAVFHAVRGRRCRCARSVRPVRSCPTFCVSSGALRQPDPECCESLFIKSIPAL